MRISAVAIILLMALAGTPASGAAPFELNDGDRVVLIGDTLIEREQRYGYWEAALTGRWPERTITFRNLGWSGDTVWGEARAGFDTPAQGFRRLVEHTLALKPTVIVVGYGGNEAFDGPEGLPRFKDGLRQLLDALAPARARTVILAPLHLERPDRRLPDPATVNEHRGLYRDALRKAASVGGHRFIDFFQMSAPGMGPWTPLTDDGMHLSPQGYQATASWLEQGLGLPERKSSLSPRQLEALRQAIVAKNQQYFYRWRPQNETYLFGFRKHEQGKNAAEVPLFDPVIDKLEREIARLRRPAASDGSERGR